MDGIFARAAYLLQSEANYSRHADGSVLNPDTDCFSLTGLIERANTRRANQGVVMKWRTDDVAAAKAALCRKLGVAHLSVWEWSQRPKWDEVKALLEEAETEAA